MLTSLLSRRPSLRMGAAGSVAFLGALLVVGLGGWQILETRDALLGGAEVTVKSLSRALAQHAARTVESVDLTLKTVVEHVTDQPGSATLSAFLHSRADDLVQARNIIVMDQTGDWLADTVPPHGPLNGADRAYFQWHRDHAARGMHLEAPIIGRTSGRLSIPMSRRIDRPDGSFGGVVVATVAPDYFAAFYRSVETSKQGAVALWLDDGRMLVRSPALPNGAALPTAPLAEAAKAFASASGTLRTKSPLDGIERIVAFEHVDGYPLVVSSAISIDDALAGWMRDALGEGIAVAVAALSMIALGVGLEAHGRRVKLFERDSREAERRYRLLAEHSSDLITLKPSFCGPRSYASPSSRLVVGWEPDELLSLPIGSFVHPDDVERVAADFACLSADRPRILSLHRVRHKAGHYLWLESVFRRTDDGSVIVSGRDVTARCTAEHALAESEARFRQLADASSDMIQQLDLEGRRLYVSPAAQEIFGLEPAEMIGTHPVDFIHPDDAGRVGGWIQALTTGERDKARSIHRVRRKDGHYVSVEVQFRLVRDKATGAPFEIVSSVRDVTQRESLRQELESANRALLMAEEIAEVGHWRLELPDNRLVWSNEVYRIHGRDPQTYAPSIDTAIGLFHPDDRAEVERCVSQAVLAQQSYEFGLRILRPDGEVRHVLSRGVCEIGAAGDLTAIFGTIMDVTELRQAERAAIENEARFRLLAENTTDMITYMDLDFRRTFISPGSQELLGYGPEELLDTNPVGLIHPEDTPLLKPKLDDLAAGKIDQAVHINRVRHKDGRWIWVEATVKLIRSEDGAPAGLVSIVRNINDRKLADQALRDSEARYRVLAETTSDVITQLDLALSRQYVSPSCRKVLGYEPDEMLGVRPSAKIHPEDAAEVRAVAARLAAGEVAGDRVTATYRSQHKAGHWIWIEAAINLVRDEASGAPLSLICSLRDVSERQLAAQNLTLAKAAAEQAAQAKSEFLANMSHELRTPLTGILGIHDLMHADAAFNDNQKRLVRMAAEAGRSLLAIVNDVLDFSKIEAGQLTIEQVPFDLDDLIDKCRNLAAEGIGEKPLQIVVERGSDRLGSVMGDPTRLGQVLLNLLTNAVKFTPAGEIVVRAVYREDTGALRVDVTDSGIGIPADRIGSLFDRFTQADSTMTRRYGGTGLGLAICKRLMDLMEGRIGAEGLGRQGSNFWFEVTLTRSVGIAVPPAAPEVALVAGRSLLLAEDNTTNAEIIAAMLQAQGYAVTVVGDGAQAAHAARPPSGFDVILMDLQMPVMDGLSATKLIRRQETEAGLARTPIVGLTANAMPEDAARCREAGMDGHVAKPVDWSRLFTTLNLLLGSSTDSGSNPQLPDLTQILELRRLEELSALLGRDRLATMLARFFEDLAVRLDLVGSGSARVLSDQTHMLVSTSGQLGFRELGALCGEINAAARGGAGLDRLDDLRRAAMRASEAAARSGYVMAA